MRQTLAFLFAVGLLLMAKQTQAQIIDSDPIAGIYIKLDDGQTNTMTIWVHNSTTNMNINGQFFTTDGVNNSLSQNLTIVGGNQKDVITMHGSSNTANITVDLNEGDDEFDAQLNRPLEIFGGPGNDVIFGGNQDDRLWGDAGDDELHGRQGKDEIIGGHGKDVLYGEEDGDLLMGGFGKDKLFGGPGKDTMVGGQWTSLGHYLNVPAWNDWLAMIPDFAEDELSGGPHQDVFLSEIFHWSSYTIYEPGNGIRMILPNPGAQKVVLDSEFLVDFNSREGDTQVNWAIPKLPFIKFYGAPKISF